MKKYLLSAFASFLFLTYANAQTDAHRVREGDFYGFKNAKNEWLIEPKYEIFDSPYGDFMIAQNDQKLRGAINRTGDTLVPFEFQAIKPVQGRGFGEGKNRRVFVHFLAKKGDKWGLIDSSGRAIVPLEFEIAEWVDDTTAFFSRPGRQMLRNDLGQTLLETDFERAELLQRDFRKSRHLVVSKNYRLGLIDFSNKTVVPFEFRFIRLSPFGNFVDIQTEKGERGIWDLTGRERIAPKFGSINFLTDSLFFASLFEGNDLGLFDITGRERMPCEFAEIRLVGSSGRLKARKKGGFFGLFDADGKALTFPELADFEANDLLPNLIFAKEQSGQWLVVNRDGRHVNQDRFDKWDGVSALGFVAYQGDLSAIFLPDGRTLTPYKYRYVQIFNQKDKSRKNEKAHGLNPETYFIGSTKDGGEWRLIDNFGKEYPLEPPQKTAQKPKSTDDILVGFEEPGNDDGQKIYDLPEKKPQFPGGETARNQFIIEHLKYPDAAKKAGIQGAAYIQFVVETDGSITSPIILRDIGGACGAAAIEVVKKMPHWLPATHHGRPVRAKFTLPIRFKL